MIHSIRFVTYCQSLYRTISTRTLHTWKLVYICWHLIRFLLFIYATTYVRTVPYAVCCTGTSHTVGMREDQIKATWGLWSIRGSDLDINNPEAGSRYPESDPTPEEVEFLHGLINLSPSCHTNPRGCFRIDNVTLVEEYKSEFDYILFIDNGGDDSMKTVEEETGVPVVFIDTFYEYDPECRFTNFTVSENYTNCFGRSMIDIAKRVEELAIALGTDIDTERVESDKQAACEAAYEFSETMKQKQEEGVRFMTSINAINKDENGIDFFEFRTIDPIKLWIPRTLEELGMPILHHDDGSLTLQNISTRVTGNEYFLDCPEGDLSVDCNDNTMYPVDFWLWDSRSYLNIIGVDTVVFESLFPDKAILAGQHWHYARNDGAVSYNAIARMLTTMTEKVKGAQRLYDDETPCVDVDPKTTVTAIFGGGLDRNEYVCYNEDLIQKEYLTCDRPTTTEAPVASPVSEPVASPVMAPVAGTEETPAPSGAAQSTTFIVAILAGSIMMLLL